MNKYNIEVGDNIIGGDGKPALVVKVFKDAVSFIEGSTSGLKFSYVNENLDSGFWKHIKKMNKKIIGYTLLKDTPTVKAGAKYLKHEANGNWSTEEGKYANKAYAYKQALDDTEWFSPIYEEVKPTEVYVDTLAGKVKVTKDFISLESVYAIPLAIKEFTKIVGAVKSFGNAQKVGEYELKVNTFNVGCQLFSVDDIPKIEEAIKQVS